MAYPCCDVTKMREDAQTLQSLQSKCFLSGNSQTTTFTKLKPCNYVLSCLARFMAKSSQERKIDVFFFTFCGPFFLIELYMPLYSVSLIWESFIYDFGFNSQTLNGSL